MKKNYLLFLSLTIAITIFAGDTTTVRIHDQTDMTWYGNYDEWGELPDATNDYRKVYLHYTMGCATGVCSDWDYTSQIIVRHRTGAIDSTLQNSPIFTVNGIVLDSVLFSDTAYVHFWNTTNNTLDSNLSTLLEIIAYKNADTTSSMQI